MSFWRKLKIKVRNRWNDYQFKKNFLLVLFWLSIASLFIGVHLASYLSEITNDLTESKYMWVLLLFLPLPISSIVLGKKYKKLGYPCKKNIIGGIIMSFFLCIYACFTIFYFAHKDLLSDDYSYLKQLEEKIKFDFPKDGKIYTSKLNAIKTDNYQIISTSLVEFNHKEEIRDLEDRIQNSSLWTNNNSSYLQMLEPSIYIGENNKNKYYLIYMEDLNTFNTIPNLSGNYKTFCLVYEMDKNILNIYEYYLMFSV